MNNRKWNEIHTCAFFSLCSVALYLSHSSIPLRRKAFTTKLSPKTHQSHQRVWGLNCRFGTQLSLLKLFGRSALTFGIFSALTRFGVAGNRNVEHANISLSDSENTILFRQWVFISKGLAAFLPCFDWSLPILKSLFLGSIRYSQNRTTITASAWSHCVYCAWRKLQLSPAASD